MNSPRKSEMRRDRDDGLRLTRADLYTGSGQDQVLMTVGDAWLMVIAHEIGERHIPNEPNTLRYDGRSSPSVPEGNSSFDYDLTVAINATIEQIIEATVRGQSWSELKFEPDSPTDREWEHRVLEYVVERLTEWTECELAMRAMHEHQMVRQVAATALKRLQNPL